MSAQVRLTEKTIPAEILDQLQPDESALTGEVSERGDTYSIIVTDGDKLIAYAVFGLGEGDLAIVYAARVLVPGLGPMMLKSLFGASQVMGAPLRVCLNKIGRLNAVGRSMGADFCMEAEDGDGRLQGLFT